MISISIAFISNLVLPQERGLFKEIRETALQLQQMIREKQAEGVDVSEVLELDRRSQEAMRQGRPQECLRLLREAISLLEEDKGKPIRRYQALNSQDYQDSPFGIQDVHHYDPLLNDLGVHWVRLSGEVGAVWDADEPEKGKSDWRRLDKIISDFSRNDVNIPITVLSFNKWDRNIVPSENQGLVAADLPRDMWAYKNYLKTLVKKYPQVKYWQIENEPDGNGWGDTPENFAILMKESYNTIKEANPNAKVVLGGMSVPEGFYKFYLPVLNELERIKDFPNLRYFDAVDLHWSAQFGGDYRQHIPSGGNLNDFLKDLRLKLNSFGYPLNNFAVQTFIKVEM